MNVWIASLNLECLYGTDETLNNVFNEAVKRNEPKKVYLKMTDIYIKNGKSEVYYDFITFHFFSIRARAISYSSLFDFLLVKGLFQTSSVGIWLEVCMLEIPS